MLERPIFERIVSLALVAASGGCSLAPPHERPVLPVPLTYPQEFSPELGERSVADIGWRQFFTDPRLQTLIGLALDHNRDLRIAVARIEEARGQYRVQAADRLPTIDLDAQAVRSRTGPDLLGAQAGGAIIANRYDVEIGVSSFELDFWGRVRSLGEAARSNYLSTVAAERAFRLSLIRDVAINYLTARELAERIELAEATVTSRREGLHIARLRLDAGVTSALDFRQAETLLTQAETELASLRLARARTRNFSYVLIGREVPAELPDSLPMSAQGIIRDIGPGLASDLLVNRPDIVAAEEQLRAARADVGAARAAFFPSISLTGAAGFASTALRDLVGSDGLSWRFGPSINLPFLNWGRTRGNLAVAEARAGIALADYEQSIQRAFREVADGLAGRRYLDEQIAAQQRALVAQRRLASLARLRYANGVAQYIEVLDAERTLFSSEQAMIQLRRAELENLVSLYVALGGGLTTSAD